MSKNRGMKPATTRTGLFVTRRMPIAMNWPTAPAMKPRVTALLEPKPKVTAQSTPGTEPLRNLLEMPVKETVSSATRVRTPSWRMVR